ncbi:SDR family NAD(P)-dependent oxidoreductase [Shumkonia mesophila]|uniref:SDR family NAD(P)-dependent oxidoreductase n=1 Tax=Shumkonia mesophila TaxID=2838854 RepID=UPI0029341132|nr:SDR family oxidoreductase [Shumkonia mesophila]
MSPETTERPRRSVLVTGGSSGIGAEFARAAARRGWQVWLGYATGEERARRLAGELAEGGADVFPVCLPLDDAARLEAGMARVVAEGPLPQAALLCGSPPPDVASLLKLTAASLRHQMECAVVGNHALLTRLWRHCFRAHAGGHVLAVLSAAQGPRPTPHMAGYVTAKGALESLLYAAAAEWGAAGLRVSVVRPGFVDTPMLKAFPSLLVERALGQSVPLLSPHDVAAALVQALDHPPASGTVAEIPLRLRKAS